MNKIPTVIFGGSFNPVHNGHLALAREVCSKGLAGEVWFMVSPLNPHKAGEQLAPEEARFRMVELATEGDSRLKASDFEFSLPRPSYTVNTLAALRKAYPSREFILLIGADNWGKFHKWYKWEDILANHKIIVYPRGCEEQPPLPQGVTWLSAALHNVSSTQVREAVAAGGDISAMVAPQVCQYIKENKLYTTE